MTFSDGCASTRETSVHSGCLRRIELMPPENGGARGGLYPLYISDLTWVRPGRYPWGWSPWPAPELARPRPWRPKRVSGFRS